MSRKKRDRQRRDKKYRNYHARVVSACVALMGEDTRIFFDKECSYENYFREKEKPADVAQYQYEALT